MIPGRRELTAAAVILLAVAVAQLASSVVPGSTDLAGDTTRQGTSTTASWSLDCVGHECGKNPTARHDFAIAHDWAGHFSLMTGGTANGTLPYDSDAWVWYDSNETWQEVASDPLSASDYLSAASWFPGCACFILVGGEQSGGNTNNTTLAYYPLNNTWHSWYWTQLGVHRAPPTFEGGAMAYDAKDNELVLYIGAGALWYSYTWTWNGEWTNVTGSSGVSIVHPRSQAALATDSSGVVLYGGAFGAAQEGGTYQFSSGSWSKLTTPSAPPSTYDPGFANVTGPDGSYDLWFGGENASAGNSFPQVTWEFSGSTWTNVSAALALQPEGREAWMVSASAGEVWLWGGSVHTLSGTVEDVNDSWIWNDTCLTQSCPSGGGGGGGGSGSGSGGGSGGGWGSGSGESGGGSTTESSRGTLTVLLIIGGGGILIAALAAAVMLSGRRAKGKTRRARSTASKGRRGSL